MLFWGIHVRWPFLNRVFSTIIFYVGWIICLKEASEPSYYGMLLVVGFLVFYFYNSVSRKADYLLLSLVLFIGPLSDSFYAQMGLFQYHSLHTLPAWLPPLWVFVLWGLFGANIQLFYWLHHRLWLAMILGAVGGPLSYLSVVKLGAISLLQPLPLTLIAIGLMWAVFFPAFIWLNEYLKKRID